MAARDIDHARPTIVLARVDEVLRPFGSRSRYEALVLLTFSSRGSSLPLGKMGERLMIHPTSVTNIVDRLEASRSRRPRPTPHRPAHHAVRDHVGRPRRRRAATDAITAAEFGIAGLGDRDVERLIELLATFRSTRSGDFER